MGAAVSTIKSPQDVLFYLQPRTPAEEERLRSRAEAKANESHGELDDAAKAAGFAQIMLKVHNKRGHVAQRPAEALSLNLTEFTAFAEEYKLEEAKAAKLFKKFDKNKDNELNLEELTATIEKTGWATIEKTVVVYPGARLQLWQSAAQRSAAKEGASAPETLLAYARLSQALRSAGEMDEARTVLEGVLEKQTEQLGEGSAAVLETQGNMSSLLGELGQHGAARVLEEKQVSGWLELHGATHEKTMAARESLAATFKKLSAAQKALADEQATLADKKRVEGVAREYSGSARSQYELLLNAQREKLGREHQLALSTQNALAVLLYEELEQKEDGLIMMRDVVTMWTTQLGVEHKYTKRWAYTLSVWEVEAEETPEALALAQAAAHAQLREAKGVSIEGKLIGEYNSVSAQATPHPSPHTWSPGRGVHIMPLTDCAFPCRCTYRRGSSQGGTSLSAQRAGSSTALSKAGCGCCGRHRHRHRRRTLKLTLKLILTLPPISGQ